MLKSIVKYKLFLISHIVMSILCFNIPIIIWRGLEELNFHESVNSRWLYHWAKSPYMSNVSNIRIVSLTSFLGLSVVLCCAIFRVVQTCPSEVTSPLTRVHDCGARNWTSIGSYPYVPSCAPHLHITHLAHMLVLARHFAFHVATVSSFTTLISRLVCYGARWRIRTSVPKKERIYSPPQLTTLLNMHLYLQLYNVILYS